MITKPEEHDINRAGKRLLRAVLEPLDWVVNDVQEDYGIDCNVQVFNGKSPTGSWFHVQLKSSASSDYNADHTFVSQELSIDHARHYALDMREPILLVHADVTSEGLYWYAPQLDPQMAAALTRTNAKSITARIPTHQRLPATAPELLRALDNIYLALANRELISASLHSFANSLQHLQDQETLYRAFQDKHDTLRLQKIRNLYRERNLSQARPLTEAVLADPDAAVEIKFWARIQLQGIDYAETLHAGKPQSELPKLQLEHAKHLQKLTRAGPEYLKLYSLIARRAAELETLVQESSGLFMGLHQHLQEGGNPMLVLGLYAQRSALTRQIVAKYNHCLRLARYAATYPDRWVLGRALTNIVNAIAHYLVTLHAEENLESEQTFAQSALQVCKVAAWISDETGDAEGIVLAIMSAMVVARSTDTDAYRWGFEIAQHLSDPEIRKDALLRIERAEKRWKGEPVEGDYRGDTIWQIIQNVAATLKIDLSDENSPLVKGLKIAAKDNRPERILKRCEHLMTSLGATGPTARTIQRLFNISTAGSKVIHCTLHGYHEEGRELDSAYAQFKRTHCDLCPDQKPRPNDWRYTDAVREELNARHSDAVKRLAGKVGGYRHTSED